ncbi:WW domain containing E3 ubiquitin protein ligase 1 [Trapelia coarctata]|nr:WW domain containing E3 ubiquitin protein ligase 1 [Trapelia coarctata]
MLNLSTLIPTGLQNARNSLPHNLSSPPTSFPPSTSENPLPSNYTREISSSGRPYYSNHTDKTTSWYHPAAPRLRQDPRLPTHIERRVDVKGRSYYSNHGTKETSWLDPLKIDEVRARADSKKERERTEDGLAEYWVDYETGNVTQPTKIAGDNEEMKG